MAHQVLDINCPGCGGRVNTGEKECKFCGGAIVISTFNSVFSMATPQLNKYANSYKKALEENPEHPELNFSIASCYLRLKLYDKAIAAYEIAIHDSFDNSEAYFYAAVCLLKGQKAFVAERKNIDKIEEYINAALMIEPKGVYYYFLAYIKYDYFNRKYLNTTPSFSEALQIGKEHGLTEFDTVQLFDILLVPRPDALCI